MFVFSSPVASKWLQYDHIRNMINNVNVSLLTTDKSWFYLIHQHTLMADRCPLVQAMLATLMDLKCHQIKVKIAMYHT